MKKIIIGVLFGVVAGIVDIIPMLIQKLSWDANISAFTFWIIAGFFIATTKINLEGTMKGMAVSLLLLIPIAFIIGWKNPISLLPIIIMNLILGSILGFLIDKFGK